MEETRAKVEMEMSEYAAAQELASQEQEAASLVKEASSRQALEAMQVSLGLSRSLILRGLYLYSVVIFFHVECCIR